MRDGVMDRGIEGQVLLLKPLQKGQEMRGRMQHLCVCRATREAACIDDANKNTCR